MVEATPAGGAPFDVTGSATVDTDSDRVPVQLTLRTTEHLLLENVRWGHVNDERDPGLAVAAPHCYLTRASDRAQIAYDELG